MMNQLADTANGIVSEELEKISSGGKMDIGIQVSAKSSKDFETVILPKKEYAHVMSEIATNITADQKRNERIHKANWKLYIHRREQRIWRIPHNQKGQNTGQTGWILEEAA